MNFSSFELYQNLTNPNSSSGTAGGSQNLIDVRDVALGHALVLEHPEAGGERFIISNGPFSWAELRKSPAYHWFFRYFDVYFALHVDWFCDNQGDAAIDAGVKGIAPGTPEGFVAPQPKVVVDGSKAARVLGLQYRPKSETAVDGIKSIYELYPGAIPSD